MLIVFFIFSVLLLCWSIPMYINKKKKKKNGQEFAVPLSADILQIVWLFLCAFFSFLILIGAIELLSRDNPKPPISKQY